MKKTKYLKRYLTVLVLMLFVSNVIISHAGNDVATEVSIEMQRRHIILEEARMINEDLKSKKIDVISEIENMKDKMQGRLSETTNEDMMLQIEAEIDNYQDMINWYQEHTLADLIDIYSKTYTISDVTQSEYNIVKAQVIAMIAVGNAMGLNLASELLAHSMIAIENESYITTTDTFDIIISPTGTRMRQEATRVLNSGSMSGSESDLFPKGLSTTEMNLYLAINRFDYVFSGSSSSNLITFIINDYYDFKSTSEYALGVGYAVNTAVRAYELGIIKYYYVYIPFQAYKV